ncbi:MAG: helix-turn-helix domain-containing protein [Methanomicrobiales archaeon]|nr:helix-turn-helix domain-containing protein [Methanomicrobiales archaeon]
MCQDSNKLCYCAAGGILSVISKKWALLVINQLGEKGRMRFSDLISALGGVSPKTLSDLLKGLQSEGLVQRESFSEIPPRVEYFLTENGKGLREVMLPLLKWAVEKSRTEGIVPGGEGKGVVCVRSPEMGKPDQPKDHHSACVSEIAR